MGEAKICNAVCGFKVRPKVPAPEMAEPETEKIEVGAVKPTLVTVPPELAAEIEIEPARFVMVTPVPATMGFSAKPEPVPTKIAPEAAVEPSRPIPPRAALIVPVVILAASKSGMRATAKVPVVISDAISERNVGTPEAPVGAAKTAAVNCDAKFIVKVPADVIGELVIVKIEVGADSPTFCTVPIPAPTEILIDPAVFEIVTPVPPVKVLSWKPVPLPMSN